MSGWNDSRWNKWGPGPTRWGPTSFSDRTRVYRDTERGWIAGVCAGIADYAETEPTLVRLAAVLCLIFFCVPTLVAYAAFALVLKRKPPALFATPAEESFWRGLRNDPGAMLHGLGTRFHGLERRLARAEALVTSDEFELRRGFRDLGG